MKTHTHEHTCIHTHMSTHTHTYTYTHEHTQREINELTFHTTIMDVVHDSLSTTQDGFAFLNQRRSLLMSLWLFICP